MATAKVFKSGNSQAVRLPKEFRFNSSEVEIFRRGDEIVLRERWTGLDRAFELLTSLPDDFMADGRQDLAPEQRDDLLMSVRYLLDTEARQVQNPEEVGPAVAAAFASGAPYLLDVLVGG